MGVVACARQVQNQQRIERCNGKVHSTLGTFAHNYQADRRSASELLATSPVETPGGRSKEPLQIVIHTRSVVLLVFNYTLCQDLKYHLSPYIK